MSESPKKASAPSSPSKAAASSPKKAPSSPSKKAEEGKNELNDKILAQVNFYFSDANLKRDKFLQEQLKNNADSWVPISVLLTFNKLKELTTKLEEVAAALIESDIVELNPENNAVRPRETFDSTFDKLKYKEEAVSRTVYAKGFPKDSGTTLTQLQNFFSPFGKIRLIIMRKDSQAKFKGTCLIEYEKEEEAQKVAASDPILNYNDKPLRQLCMMKTWYEDKKAYQESVKAKKAKGELPTKKKETKGETKKEETEAPAVTYTPGLILKLSNVPVEGVSREELKEAFDCKWIDFNRGDTVATLRFEDASVLQNAKAEYETKKTPFNGAVLTVEVLEGDEEKLFWEKSEANKPKNKKKNDSRGGKGGRGRGGRGGRGGGGGRGGKRTGRDGILGGFGGFGGKNKRGREDGGGEGSNKKAKTE